MVAEIGTDLAKAKQLLESGACIGIPTETVYGLAANALNEEAVSSIFSVKERPAFDPLIVHVASVTELEKHCRFLPQPARKALEAFSPGPLTCILPKADHIPYLVTSGMDSVGLRIPAHPLTLELLNQLNFPLAAPSANPFGYVSPTTAQHVKDQLGERIPYILDGGPCRVGVESTIVDFTGKSPVVLRLGGLSLEDLEEVFGERPEVRVSSSRPTAPGMLETHYSPHAPVVILPVSAGTDLSRAGFLGFGEPPAGVHPANVRRMPVTTSMEEAAQLFFRYLRELDDADLSLIVAEPAPDRGLGRAINDRLMRAAARSTY